MSNTIYFYFNHFFQEVRLNLLTFSGFFLLLKTYYFTLHSYDWDYSTGNSTFFINSQFFWLHYKDSIEYLLVAPPLFT